MGIDLFPNGDILLYSQVYYTNIFSNNNQTDSSLIKLLTKVDHITGQTIWSNTYEYVYDAKAYTLSSQIIKNKQIWIFLVSGKSQSKFMRHKMHMIRKYVFETGFLEFLKRRVKRTSLSYF